MATRIAAILALVAFATCLVMGIVVENPFSTVIMRAIGAMIVTLFVGLIIGAMAQKMLEEGSAGKNKEIPESKSSSEDR